MPALAAALTHLALLVHLRSLAWSVLEASAIYAAFTVVVFAFERRAGRSAARYATRHFLNDVAYTLFYKGGIYNVLLLAAATNALAPHAAWLQLGLLRNTPWPVGLAVFWIGGDLAMYWWHRLQHANRWLWALHSVHHSQERLTLLTASRRHPLENLLLDVLIFLCVFHWGLGVPVRGWLPLAAAITSLAAIQHAELDWSFGPLYRLIVSPRFHAFHHSADRAHVDSNFAFLFSGWDYLFGTAAPEGPRPERYGVAGIDFHESLGRQMLQPFAMMWGARGRDASPAARPGAGEGAVVAGLLRRSGAEIESVVQGRSMGCALPSGARIRIRCAASARYEVGSVVAFRAGDALIGHRVVAASRDRRGRDLLVTRGDAALLCDPPVDPALVLGEVTARADGDAWTPVPGPAPRRGPAAGVAAVSLHVVRGLAAVDRDLASRFIERVLVLGLRARGPALRGPVVHG